MTNRADLPVACPSDVRIEVLGLPVRAYNCLKRGGVDTVGQVLAMTDDDLRAIQQLGTGTLNDIRNQLAVYLGEHHEPTPERPVVEDNAPLPTADHVTSSEIPRSPIPSPIEVLGLPVRAYNCLKRAGLHTVGQVLVMTDEDLRAIQQLGTGTLSDIRNELAVYLGEHHEPTPERPVVEDDAPLPTADHVTSSETPRSPILSPLEVLGLSARSNEALREAGCQTVGDVASKVEGGLSRNRRYMDAVSWAETKLRLDAFFAQHPSLSRPVPLKVLGLSMNSYQSLLRHGVFTVEKLAQLSDEELWDVRNIGAKSFAEIKSRLSAYLETHPELAQPLLPPKQMEPAAAPPPPSLPLADPDRLTEAQEKHIPLHDIAVERLALAEQDQHLLRKASIRNLGELAQQSQGKWERETQISQRLNRYLDWLIKQDETVWADEIDGRGISPLLRLDLASESLRGFVRKWLSSLGERERQIVEWRYGLHGKGLTLQEAGERLGITRERVRQIENRAINKLRYPSRQRCVLPLVELLRQVAMQAGGLVTEAYLGESLAEVVDAADINPPGVARLLLATQPEFVEVKKIEAWALSDLPIRLIPEINRRLASILAVECAPLCEGDLLGCFKATSWYRARADELRDEFIVACLHASETIVCLDENTYGLERWERHSQDDIILALRRLGQPAHYSEIAKAINEGLPPERQFTPRAVHIRLMQNTELFTWVGLRGTYGLKEWGVERALTYEEALTQIFEEAGHPLTYQQILAQVPEFRPYYDETSIVITLGTNERFRSLPGDTYGLAEWREEDFTEDYRLQRLFDEVEAVPSGAKPKTDVGEALDGVNGFIARAREKTNDGH